MKLFIPDISTHLKLTKPWKVKIQKEHRTNAFIEKHGDDITFPKGNILSVDRIYIRKGSRDYSSITFYSLTEPKGRFWVKLADANKIEYELEANQISQYVVTDKNQEKYWLNPISASSRSSLAKRLTENNSAAKTSQLSFTNIFFDEVWPYLKDNWTTELDYYKTERVVPINKSKYTKTRTTKSWYSSLIKNEKYYDEWAANETYQKEFMAALKKLKGYKNQTELLDMLPPRYEYKEVKTTI